MKNLLILMMLFPVALFAHPLPVAHSRHGILNGWEHYLIPALLILLAIFLAKRIITSLKQ